MVEIKHKGNFKYIEKFLEGNKKIDLTSILAPYGEQGVRVLSNATPVDSGLTANSWSYEIKVNKRSVSIYWTNSNVVNGVPIAIILQYGHGTRNGGFVQGRDYINPALKPIFDKISETIWREVISK